ncbi:MAG: glycosyltransferase family 39 protein, partial [Bacteroidales bacterium]|nr:glycosyltransferase family 39 protein [Bacteroidales bacterium]
MLSKENTKIAWFALAWFLINLVQSYFTEILEDEAYYWVYSEFLAWGYFDHPPMIAILIKLGSMIIPGELGVRLFPSLLGAATILIVYQLIPKGNRDPRIFIICIVAITLMHLNVAGFLALPDIPLVFFTSLFFLVLKRFLAEDRMIQALGLGVIIALMMYSKYHALLIIFFTILSDWKLILRKTFWVIVVVAVILYLPHIIWQVKNNFVSFQYHLISRNDPFQPRQILEYLGNQLVVT